MVAVQQLHNSPYRIEAPQPEFQIPIHGLANGREGFTGLLQGPVKVGQEDISAVQMSHDDAAVVKCLEPKHGAGGKRIGDEHGAEGGDEESRFHGAWDRIP